VYFTALIRLQEILTFSVLPQTSSIVFSLRGWKQGAMLEKSTQQKTKNSYQPIDRNYGPQYNTLKELNSVNNHMSLKVDPSLIQL
jgi:hypothetical protein